MNISKEKIIAYLQLMRLHKPIGTLLLMWPTVWALQLAYVAKPVDWNVVIIFLSGVFLMRTAGCVINDIADKNFDQSVSRTQYRPLACGKISVKQAWIVLLILMILAFLLLYFLNFFTQCLAVVAVMIAMIYPLMKRFFNAPQFILGLAFSWGILMVFAEVHHHISLVAILLFFANLCWTIAYDTMYAMVDREDDIKIGIRSTAIWFGHQDRLIIFILQMLMLFFLWIIGMYLKTSLVYFLSFMILFLDVLYQQYLIKNREPALCFKAFMHNNFFGLLIFLLLSIQ